MKAFRRGGRYVRLAWFAPAIALAVTLASCTGSQVSVRDMAYEVLRGVTIESRSWVTADSVCTAVILRHPILADSVMPFFNCWPLVPALDSADTGIDYDTTGGDAIPDGPIG